jgi:phosphoribosylformylglycinamidine (FGAM) synthase-like amidotransferase family enzyme
MENSSTPSQKKLEKGEVIRMPIAHGEGRFYVPEDELKRVGRERTNSL